MLKRIIDSGGDIKTIAKELSGFLFSLLVGNLTAEGVVAFVIYLGATGPAGILLTTILMSLIAILTSSLGEWFLEQAIKRIRRSIP